jgi:glycosyltransferase involved in cell wall biosynthesis
MDPTLDKNVTIGFVTKNCEGTVRDAISSVVKQNYPHELMEIVIVDGESRDETLSIVRDVLSKTDIRSRICFDGGRGLGVARQMVVDEAHCEYLVWVDGDDVIPEDYVDRLVELMEANPNLGGAKAQRVIMDASSLAGKLENLDLALRTTSRHIFDGHGVLRLPAVRNVDGFDPRIKGAGEDIDLIMRMRSAGWSFAVSRAKFYHRADTWTMMWNRGIRDGYSAHYLNRKHKGMLELWTRAPPITALLGLRDSRIAYRLKHQKASFLLPFLNVIKSLAYWVGFAKAYIDEHGQHAAWKIPTAALKTQPYDVRLQAYQQMTVSSREC